MKSWGEFLCQGKVDPALIKMMETKMKDNPHHRMTPGTQSQARRGSQTPG